MAEHSEERLETEIEFKVQWHQWYVESVHYNNVCYIGLYNTLNTDVCLNSMYPMVMN